LARFTTTGSGVEDLADADGVAERVADAEVDAVGPFHRLVGDVDTAVAQRGEGCVGVVGGEEQRPRSPPWRGARAPDAAVSSSIDRGPGALEQDLAGLVARHAHGEPAHEAEVDVGGDLQPRVPT
jgi:hypothetical protein